MANIGIVGAGTWGIVIADLLIDNNHQVTVYARKKEQIESLEKSHVHQKLPGIILNDKIKYTNDIKNVCENKEIIVLAVPSTAFRNIAKEVVKYVGTNTTFVSLTKGLEDKTLYTMSEIIEDELKKNNILNDKIVVLSGPTHAEEVGKKFPSNIVSASKNINSAKYIQDIFMNQYFRVYTNQDVKGVEICAAFKNLIAIASGILTGLGFGDNVRAALITRGLAEMIRVGEKTGCMKDTFYGLAGIGDMIVTACSEHSRNFNFGKLIGKGMNVDEALKEIGMVVEGVNFIPKAIQIRDKYNLELPITSGVADIVINGAKPKDILKLLMTRKKKSE